jgi:hypothetical protein
LWWLFSTGCDPMKKSPLAQKAPKQKQQGSRKINS